MVGTANISTLFRFIGTPPASRRKKRRCRHAVAIAAAPPLGVPAPQLRIPVPQRKTSTFPDRGSTTRLTPADAYAEPSSTYRGRRPQAYWTRLDQHYWRPFARVVQKSRLSAVQLGPPRVSKKWLIAPRFIRRAFMRRPNLGATKKPATHWGRASHQALASRGSGIDQSWGMITPYLNRRCGGVCEAAPVGGPRDRGD